MTTPQTIACVFHNTVDLGVKPGELIAALQLYANLLADIWKCPCSLAQASAVPPSTWALVFTDDADQANALGYHESTPDELPLGHVFVRTSVNDNVYPSVSASHELAEMLVDPGCNLGAFTPRGRWVALEVCDPVESYAFPINGIPLSNYVYPAWFGYPGNKFDAMNLCTDAFHVKPGGYIPIWQNGRWSNLFGSASRQERYLAQDRRGHRPQRRRM
jgi:hypothetical protein